jgi:iron complex outermembrane receptor protein
MYKTIFSQLVSGLLSGLMSVLCACSIAYAQGNEDPEETRLDPIRVEDTADSESAYGPVEGYRAVRSATGTKTDTPLIEIPQSISVITAEQIRDQNAQNLQEVLSYSAGVRAATYGMDNRGDWFTLRGSSESSVLLDGLRLPLSGWYGSVRSEPYAFERIEVLRGPSSIVAGQNAPGGVVNMVTKLPQAQAKHEVSLQAGNFEHRQIAADSTGPLGDGNVLYRVVLLSKDSGTQIEHVTEERQYFAPSFSWLPGDKTILTVYGQYQKDESMNTNAFLPWAGSLYPANGRYIPQEIFIGEPEWDSYGGERIRLGYQFEYAFNKTWSLRHNLRQDDLEGHLASMYANFWEVDAQGNGFVDATGTLDPEGTHINRTWYASRTDSKVLNTDLLLEGRLHADPVEHTFLFGIDVMNFDDNQTTLDGAATPLDMFNPAYGGFAKPELDFGPGTPIKTRNRGLLVQDQIKFGDHWVIVAGARQDEVNIEVDDAGVTAPIDDSATTFRAGLVYLTDSGWAPYLSYSESFEAISGKDSDKALFKPKRGEQVEAGVKWSPEDTSVIFSAAAYTIKETNRPILDMNDPVPTDIYDQIQAGEVTVDGIEFDLSADLASWSLLANYSYTDARITKGTAADLSVGMQLSSIPERAASLWAIHDFTSSNLRAGGGMRYVSTTGDGAGVIDTPANTLFDAMVSYERDEWSYALNANNLFDEQYVVTCLNRGDCWFGTQREIVATANYRF